MRTSINVEQLKGMKTSNSMDIKTGHIFLKDLVCYLSLLEAGRPEDKLECKYGGFRDMKFQNFQAHIHYAVNTLNPYLTNGFSHHYQLDEYTFIFRDVRSDF